ncbi:MAG: MFS transporter [Chloroflexi bacterium]|nr:MFS transporter [Chloroflexota bacterium]
MSQEQRPPASEPPSAPWRRTLLVMAVVQGAAVMGFGLVYPFMPLFIQELGVAEPRRAAFWTGIGSGGVGLGMAVAGPIWGSLGDRFGRKRTLLLCYLSMATVLALTALVTNVYQLTGARWASGFVWGFLPVTMGLAAAATPRQRVAYAMGLMQGMGYVGMTLGPALGGFVVTVVGYRGSFLAASSILVFCAILVHVAVREPASTSRSPGRGSAGILRSISDLTRLPGMGPLLLLIFLVYLGPPVLMPVLPAFIGTLVAGTSAPVTGAAFSIMGLAGAVASYLSARLSQRVGLRRVLVGAALVAAAAYVGLSFAQHASQVLVIVVFIGLGNGLLVPQANALVATLVPQEQQGSAYGLVQSVNSVAFGGGPFVSGATASLVGLRPVFYLNTAVFALLALVAARLLHVPQVVPTPARATISRASPGQGRGGNPDSE